MVVDRCGWWVVVERWRWRRWWREMMAGIVGSGVTLRIRGVCVSVRLAAKLSHYFK